MSLHTPPPHSSHTKAPTIPTDSLIPTHSHSYPFTHNHTHPTSCIPARPHPSSLQHMYHHPNLHRSLLRIDFPLPLNALSHILGKLSSLGTVQGHAQNSVTHVTYPPTSTSTRPPTQLLNSPHHTRPTLSLMEGMRWTRDCELGYNVKLAGWRGEGRFPNPGAYFSGMRGATVAPTLRPTRPRKRAGE